MNFFKVGFVKIVLLVITVILLGCASPYEKRVQAINNGELSQVDLATIAVNEYEYRNIRILAIKNVTDQTLLAKIAIKGKDYMVRDAAVKNVTDQTLLAIITFECEDFNVSTTAMNKLTDKTVLCKHVLVGKTTVIDNPVPVLSPRKLNCEVISVSPESGNAMLKCPEVYMNNKPLTTTVPCFYIPR
jgi:hypothetical protein